MKGAFSTKIGRSAGRSAKNILKIVKIVVDKKS
jgi:hypothetical protein